MPSLPIGIADNAKPWTGQPDATISFTASPSTTNNNTVYTFSNAAIGDADANRVVAVAVFANSLLGDFVGVTIGGITATKATSVFSSETAGNAAGIFYANVPTGTTATIVITCNDEASRCATAVYRIIPGYGRTATLDTAGAYASSIEENEVIGGVSVWGSVTPNASTAYTVERNGSSLTTSISGVYSGSSLIKSGKFDVTGSANAQVEATYSSTSNNIVLLCATWR